jgi:hypothetical protein
VIELMELITKDVAGVAPNETPVAPVRFVPVIVTDVPPPVGPLAGLIPVTVGATTWNVNWSAAPIAETPPGVTTVTSTPPATCAGAIAVMEESEFTWKLVAAVAPNKTTVAPVKLLPVSAMLVPPPVEPLEGLKLLTTGAGI